MADIAAWYAAVWCILIFPGFELIKFWANECYWEFAENIEDLTRKIFYVSLGGWVGVTIFALLF